MSITLWLDLRFKKYLSMNSGCFDHSDIEGISLYSIRHRVYVAGKWSTMGGARPLQASPIHRHRGIVPGRSLMFLRVVASLP